MSERSRSMPELLGYPTEARLLVINADDFGMCHAENAATISGLEQGAFCSATVMVPCPWFEAAADFARHTPEADIGVHITHTSEWATYKWGPICGVPAVPSLVDARGYFHAETAAVYAHAGLEDIERETRAQIDRALAAGIDVTHLDSHMGTLQLDPAYHRLYLRLAAAYRVPIRMVSRAALQQLGLEDIGPLADQLGVLSPDRLWYGGPEHPGDTARYWEMVLRGLPPGVTELYVHAALDTPEMRAVGDGWAQREADYRFFMSADTAAMIHDLGITRVGYRVMRDLQRGLQAC